MALTFTCECGKQHRVFLIHEDKSATSEAQVPQQVQPPEKRARVNKLCGHCAQSFEPDGNNWNYCSYGCFKKHQVWWKAAQAQEMRTGVNAATAPNTGGFTGLQADPTSSTSASPAYAPSRFSA